MHGAKAVTAGLPKFQLECLPSEAMGAIAYRLGRMTALERIGRARGCASRDVRLAAELIEMLMAESPVAEASLYPLPQY